MRLKTIGPILVAILLIVMPFRTATAKEAVNVEVEADQMEIIDAEHKTIFSGNVISTRPSETIKSDQMVVTTTDVKQTDGSTKSVTDKVHATGNVTIKTKSQLITGTTAIFDVQANTLQVMGNVHVTQGDSKLTGEKLVVDLDTNHLQMSGGRVKGSFIPK
jgi:lipopolysaccharide export system protein LptA